MTRECPLAAQTCATARQETSKGTKSQKLKDALLEGLLWRHPGGRIDVKTLPSSLELRGITIFDMVEIDIELSLFFAQEAP